MRTNKEAKTGDLRERVKFYSQTLTADGFGGFTNVPTLYYECWASVKANIGKRQDSESQMAIKTSWEVLIRFNPLKPIDKSMHIVYGLKTLIIDSVIDLDEHNRMVKIIANERE